MSLNKSIGVGDFTIIDFKLEHRLKAFGLMNVTELGIATDSRDEQLANADSEMIVTPSGIVTDLRD